MNVGTRDEHGYRYRHGLEFELRLADDEGNVLVGVGCGFMASWLVVAWWTEDGWSRHDGMSMTMGVLGRIGACLI